MATEQAATEIHITPSVDGDFPAPWEAFPDVPRFSIGWRMGRPEHFLMQWHDLYMQLDKWQRRNYRRMHRAPWPLWAGFYLELSRKWWIAGLGIIATILVFFALFLIRIVAWPFGQLVQLD